MRRAHHTSENEGVHRLNSGVGSFYKRKRTVIQQYNSPEGTWEVSVYDGCDDLTAQPASAGLGARPSSGLVPLSLTHQRCGSGAWLLSGRCLLKITDPKPLA